ncbi:hypothetical protein TIFTF001_002257 [Ficus carica]|uniref:Uncharacterized protein n=1 Tax=Ficus carica TaxID=3494 RepID=A0AA87Z313_FICCA|nr:hypothetical protein TIFTF001_002257 [Ficus carica]
MNSLASTVGGCHHRRLIIAVDSYCHRLTFVIYFPAEIAILQFISVMAGERERKRESSFFSGDDDTPDEPRRRDRDEIAREWASMG